MLREFVSPSGTRFYQIEFLPVHSTFTRGTGIDEFVRGMQIRYSLRPSMYFSSIRMGEEFVEHLKYQSDGSLIRLVPCSSAGVAVVPSYSLNLVLADDLASANSAGILCWQLCSVKRGSQSLRQCSNSVNCFPKAAQDEYRLQECFCFELLMQLTVRANPPI